MSEPIEKLLFFAASGLANAGERRTLLDYACQHDPHLRERLSTLLDIQGEADTFFEFQPGSVSRIDPAQPTGEEGLDARIGRYRLITRVGVGGCGVVYLAEQQEPVLRKVALKIIKLGMDTETVIARFALERQTLALMDHPNIAHVFDAGATSSGRPYFVMEFVDGEQITAFCDANRLTVRQRLELFVEVCRAIQHAHQKGVINRDIKPSNILVHWREDVPMPKIIDFGIAKATLGSMANGETFTPSDQFVGTPAYMSPEQAQGSPDIDTRSDIYSLGVLLYELLSGRTPFDLKHLADQSMDEVRRIIREEQPKPPSAALKSAAPEEREAIADQRGTDAPRLTSQLAGDLDWIVMRAIEKERGRRYESATGLMMDVLRYLRDEPVLARPPSRAYLLGKMVRRNKLLVTTASIAVFGLAVGFGASTWMFFQEKAARQEQVRLRQAAELRGEIARAAVKVSYGDLAKADQLLAKIPVEQTPSSLEAANAFRAVAEWHVREGRWKNAAAQFSSMARAISSVDDSDLPSVSLNLLPAAATVAYASGTLPYEEIRRLAIKRFGSTANLIVAEQTLKACLLLPADQKTIRALLPLADLLERSIETDSTTMTNDSPNVAWIMFSLALLHYRAGEDTKAAQWTERCLASPNYNEARTAVALVVRAMIEQRSDQPVNARATLAQASEIVRKAFSNPDWMQWNLPVYWFDWINASVLLTEGEHLIASK